METGQVPQVGSAPSPSCWRAGARLAPPALGALQWAVIAPIACALGIAAPAVAAAQGASKPSESSAVPVAGGEPGRRGTTWDLDVHGGYGRGFGSDELDGALFAGRVRAGVLWVQEPRYQALGAVFRLSSELPASFGVEAEYLNTETGLWFAPSAFLDTQVRPGASVSLGYSLLGVSGEVRFIDGEKLGGSVIALLRIPIGVIVWAVSQP